MDAPHQPLSFRERALLQFRSPQNQAYIANAFRRHFSAPGQRHQLSFLLKTLPSAVAEYGTTYGQGGAILDSDPLGIRGSAGRSGNLIEELQHLNRVFFHQRVQEADAYRDRAERTQTGYRPGKTSDPDEPLFYQMFYADSIRPEGHEGLNDGGALWALNEDRTPFHDPSVAPEDQAWSHGEATRSAEDLMDEYYGSETPIWSACGSGCAPSQQPPTNHQLAGGKSVCGWDSLFEQRRSTIDYEALRAQSRAPGGLTERDIMQMSNPGRASRYEKIPVWQKGGHRADVLAGRDDASETLGMGSEEFGGERTGHVRGWDMSRLRHPRGESYARLGPTSY